MKSAKLTKRRITGPTRKLKKQSENPMNAKSQESRSLPNFYADDQIEQMKKMLSEYWAEHLNGETIAEILMGGNVGYDNLNKQALIREFESVFGENYFGRD